MGVPNACQRLPNNTFCPTCGYTACQLKAHALDRGPTLFDQAAFARSLRVRAAELGLSGRDAADAANVSRSTFSRVTRHYTPDVESYLRLVAWLEVTRVDQSRTPLTDKTGPGMTNNTSDKALP